MSTTVQKSSLITGPRIGIGVAVLALVLIASALMGGGSNEPTAAASREMHEVEKISFRVDTTAAGDLQAKNEKKLISEVEGTTTITEIIEEGAFVKQGDVLIKLSDDELKKQLDNETLSLESARSDLIAAQNALKIQESDNESNLAKAKLKLDVAELELKKWRDGDVEAKTEELQSAFDSANRNHDRLKKKFENSKKLRAQDFISEDEYERDEIAYKEAESNLTIAEIRRRVYHEYEYHKELKQREADISEATAELERVRTNNSSELANRQANLNNRTKQLSIREDKVAKLQEQLDNCVITAPTDGLVVYATSVGNNWRWDNRGPLVVGRQVRHNEELIVLPDTSRMNAVIKVHESMVGKIRPGLSAMVTIDAAQGQTFKGTVGEIGIMAESGGWRDPNLREYEVKIELELPDGPHGLKPSMRCEAEVIMDEVNDVLAVPTHAIFAEGDVKYVLQPKGSRYERVPVIPGRRSDNHIEILAGVEEGDQVALIDPAPGQVIEDEFDMELVAKLREEAGVPAGGPRMFRAAMGQRGGKKAAEEASSETTEIDLSDIENMSKEDLEAAVADLDAELGEDDDLAEDDEAEIPSGDGDEAKPATATKETEQTAQKPSAD